MSGTQVPSATTAQDRVNMYGTILVSSLVLMIFQAAICIAWWTKDSSLQVLLGMAGSNAGIAVGFWLGSSSGSRAKDAKIPAAPTA